MNRIALLLLVLPGAAAAQIMLGQATAIDGDTLAFGDEMIRIHGIDAVEAAQTCERDGEVWACGEEATQLMRDLLLRGQLQCQQMDRDHYRRLVATCRVGRVDIGATMVAAGFAVALPQYSDSYVAAEETARAQGVGIWSGSFQMPSDYRAAQADFEELRPAPRRFEQSPAQIHAPQAQAQWPDVFYRNCDAARAAGAAPLRRDSPGYRPALDADGDGIACEPYRGRR